MQSETDGPQFVSRRIHQIGAQSRSSFAYRNTSRKNPPCKEIAKIVGNWSHFCHYSNTKRRTEAGHNYRKCHHHSKVGSPWIIENSVFNDTDLCFASIRDRVTVRLSSVAPEAVRLSSVCAIKFGSIKFGFAPEAVRIRKR